MTKSKPVRSLLLATSLAVAGIASGTPAGAQVPALLPSVGEVEPSAPLAIDGMYTIREIHKRIVIENGYAYAVDSWVHALIFRIMPNQIVMRDIRPLPDGNYIAEDLPLMARVKIEPTPDGSLLTRTVTGLPSTFHLDPAGFDASLYPDPGFEPAPLPPHGETPPENPDAGEEPVDPWTY